MKHPYDRLNFEPGLIYIIYGEANGQYAYKIGMTKRTPEDRVRAAKSESWSFSNNLQVIHQIHVDNMRVAEMMFHQRFRDQRVIAPWARSGHIEHCAEWFALDNKVDALRKCKSVYLSTALSELAQTTDTRAWWTQLDADARRATAIMLWKRPLLRIEW